MAKPYGLPNRVVSEICGKIFESPKLLNYIYYTGKEYENVDLFKLEPPSANDVVDKNIFIGRRIPNIMRQVGAFIDIRVNRYEPLLVNFAKKSPNLIKYVDVNIDVICHTDCQKTLRGTRDITIITLLQEILETADLTGIAENASVTSVYNILGLEADYNGYTLTIRVTGFNQGLYNED